MIFMSYAKNGWLAVFVYRISTVWRLTQLGLFLHDSSLVIHDDFKCHLHCVKYFLCSFENMLPFLHFILFFMKKATISILLLTLHILYVWFLQTTTDEYRAFWYYDNFLVYIVVLKKDVWLIDNLVMRYRQL
jgi:hypothetical protein